MRISLLAVLVACGGSTSIDPAEIEHPLTLERWSPPQATSYDVFLGARDSVVVLQNRISRDAGETWSALDPSLGSPSRIAITGGVIATYSSQRGLVRWDLTTDAITDVAGPAFASERNWRTEPTTGRLIVFHEVDNAIVVEGAAPGSLPQPTPTQTAPYIQDLESNGHTMLTVSAWGVHRSSDGITWELVTASLPGGGRDLIALADGRFVLVGGATSYVFDAQGQAAGTRPGFGVADGEATACDDGSIVARGKLTRDVGTSWEKLIPDTLDMVVERSGCGAGSYWALASSSAWGYRLVRFDAPGTAGIVVGNWEAARGSWQTTGPSIARADDGEFLVAGLAWREGEAWSLRETPSQIWASGTSLFGASDAGYFVSSDGGVRWRAIEGSPLAKPEAFARSGNALLVAQFTGDSSAAEDRWTSRVWRSVDDGATWTVACDQTATRSSGADTVGEAHRFVGVAADGSWIATDAVSTDQGATWMATETTGDRSLSFLTRNGHLVTTLPAADDIWRVYADGGLGPLLATHRLEVEGMPVAASSLRSLAFDDEGYVYVARGAPYVQIWRSTLPVEAPAIP